MIIFYNISKKIYKNSLYIKVCTPTIEEYLVFGVGVADIERNIKQMTCRYNMYVRQIDLQNSHNRRLKS